MTTPVQWGSVAQKALTPYHVRSAARQAYGLVPAMRSNSGMGQLGHSSTYWTVWGLLSTASMAASAYHGYKRNESVGWALVWGLCGALFPVITPVIAVAQGYGEPDRG